MEKKVKNMIEENVTDVVVKNDKENIHGVEGSYTGNIHDTDNFFCIFL